MNGAADTEVMQRRESENEVRASDDEAVAAEKAINEEYKLWKKNAPYLYDTVVTHALEWPSLTVQWMPDVEVVPGRDAAVHRLLLGTHTSDGAPNYVQLATVHLPSTSASRAAALSSPEPAAKAPRLAGAALDGRSHDDERREWGGHGAAPGGGCRIAVTQRIPHAGEVNRARYMPSNPCVLATRTPSGEVHVFDYTKHASSPASGAAPTPDLRLCGQDRDGYGLAWSCAGGLPHELLAGASEDTTVCVWDISAGGRENAVLDPVRTLRGHTAAAEDVSWQARSRSVLASVGDDRRLCIWDLRQASDTVPSLSVTEAHGAEVNCVAFSPANDWMLATGASDGVVALWDTRKMSSSSSSVEACLHRMEGGHGGEVLSVAWSPHMPGVLASGGADRRVHVWDLTRIGREQDAEDAEDGPPELLFVHGGHTAKVSDLAWCPNEPWLLASVAEDNIVQVWQMASAIYEESDAEDASSEGGMTDDSGEDSEDRGNDESDANGDSEAVDESDTNDESDAMTTDASADNDTSIDEADVADGAEDSDQ